MRQQFRVSISLLPAAIQVIREETGDLSTSAWAVGDSWAVSTDRAASAASRGGKIKQVALLPSRRRQQQLAGEPTCQDIVASPVNQVDPAVARTMIHFFAGAWS